jgi:hypothetical protein
MGVFASPVCADNELAIGKFARTSGVIDIPILPPAELNFKTRSEIFAMRNREISKHPQLLVSGYAPSNNVFGQVEDSRPWWGTLGEAYYHAGKNSIKGQAVQSRYILNPFLLAAVRSTPGLPKDKVREADLAYKNYPTTFPATGLRWWPKEGKAEVTYQLSAWESQMCSLFGYSSFSINGNLGLELINARDLGLPYVYIPPAWAYNVRLGSPMSEPIKIPQFIHCGGSCGYPGGCNNMSPATPALDDVMINKLPARVILLLWKNEPTTWHEAPDMTFTINFR